MILHWLTQLVAWDVALFCWINQGCYYRPIADGVRWLAQDEFLVLAVGAGCLLYGWKTGWRAFLRLAIWGVVAVVASNLIHNYFLKPFFDRPRPFISIPEVRLIAPLHDLAAMSLSFPSTHSASAMALAVIAGYIDPRLRWPGLTFAGCVGLGAIYSGGHYPADVLAGWIVGALLGWGMGQLRNLFVRDNAV